MVIVIHKHIFHTFDFLYVNNSVTELDIQNTQNNRLGSASMYVTLQWDRKKNNTIYYL